MEPSGVSGQQSDKPKVFIGGGFQKNEKKLSSMIAPIEKQPGEILNYFYEEKNSGNLRFFAKGKWRPLQTTQQSRLCRFLLMW
jgi:hypothetical protein